MGGNLIADFIGWSLGLGLLVLTLIALVFIIYVCLGWAFGLVVNYPSPPKVMTIYSVKYYNSSLVLYVKSWTREKIYLIRAFICEPNGTVVEIHDLNITVPSLSMATVIINNVTYRGYGYVVLIPLWGLPARHELPVTHSS